jgi:hypothetical protein
MALACRTAWWAGGVAEFVAGAVGGPTIFAPGVAGLYICGAGFGCAQAGAAITSAAATAALLIRNFISRSSLTDQGVDGIGEVLPERNACRGERVRRFAAEIMRRRNPSHMAYLPGTGAGGAGGLPKLPVWMRASSSRLSWAVVSPVSAAFWAIALWKWRIALACLYMR